MNLVENKRIPFAQTILYECEKEERGGRWLPADFVLRALHTYKRTDGTAVCVGATVGRIIGSIFQSVLCNDSVTGNVIFCEGVREMIDELPACRNDHEYNFVLGMCGYDYNVNEGDSRVSLNEVKRL